MSIRRWESQKTRQEWGTGYGNPILMILISLAINVVSLIVAVVCTLTVIRDLQDNYGGGIGWPFTIPAPAVGIIWALIDAAVCHYVVLNAVYYLVESTLLMTLNVVLGTMIFIVNSWSPFGAAPIIPGIFLLVVSLFYMAFLAVSARLHHMHNMQKRRTKTNDPAI